MTIACPACCRPMPADEAPFACQACHDRCIEAGHTQEYEMRKARRAREIRAAYDGGASPMEIARRFTLSLRSAQRYIATFTNDQDGAYRRAHHRATARATELLDPPHGRAPAFGSVARSAAR